VGIVSEVPPTGARRRGLSFRLKITLLAVTAAVVPVLVVGWLVSAVNRKALGDVNRQLIDAAMLNVAATARSTLDEADAALSKIAGVLDEPAEGRDAVVEVALDLAAGLRQIAIYDERGAHVATVDSKKPFEPPPLPAELPADLRAAGAHRYGAVRFAGRDAYLLRTFTVSEPRRLTVAGYVALAPIAAGTIALAEALKLEGHIVIVTPEKVAVADSLGERVGKSIGDGDVAMLSMFEPGALGKNVYASNVTRKADGTAVLGALRSIEGSPLTIAAEVPHHVVFTTIDDVRRFVFGAVAIAIVAAVGIGILLARRVTRPIKELVDYAGELAKRNFDRRVTIRTRDELGLLGAALERAATSLQASDEQISREVAIRNDLKRYLPNPLVEQIIARKRSLALGGDRREVTVMFADVVGFTSLAERESAETVVSLLNELFTILTEIVFRHGGTVDKFVGDCVMAVWGAAEGQPDHAKRAVLAARDMLRWLEVGNELWLEKYGFAIELAIGVNSGEAVIGNFGSETRMEYTAIGDVVNVAARLESIARPNQILTTAATRDRAAAQGEAGFVALGSRPIIGKGQAIELFEVRA
jgi:class 3 adenylate cyclase